ncbi:MAG: putative MarR family transcriptional regulator [Acidimicrobiales bacterium]|nr:putative MarR family transcriptional regulator [Acidimicrobiales bacterium]
MAVGNIGVDTSHELDAPPWLRVESTLMSTARAVREAFDVCFAPLGLNLTQASVIAYVDQFGPNTQTKIADHLHLGRAFIGSCIDRLQERELIERLATDDRRVWQICLSAEGAAIAKRIAAIDEVLRAELRSGISREERHALASVMTRLQANLARAVESATATTAGSPPSTTTSISPTTETP